MLRELDFRQESMHLLTLSANLREIAEIVVPQPVIGYTSARVLAMEFIPGTKITELTRIERRELDGERLTDALFRAYLKQILGDGMFHADPHPGNVFIVNGRIALIDLGMVARVTPGPGCKSGCCSSTTRRKCCCRSANAARRPFEKGSSAASPSSSRCTKRCRSSRRRSGARC